MNFAQPGWLLLLLLLPILGVAAVMTARLRRKQWTAFVAERLRPALLKRGNALPRWLSFIFLLAACTTTIVALARPKADAGTKTEKTLGRNVMIALDISRSMRVDDIKPDRLTQAKVIISELLETMPNERIGLLGFAGTPYIFAPLTIDHSAVQDTLDQIDENWAPLGGSDLAAAVNLATETLKKTGQKNNALIILSDGEEIRDDEDRSELEAMTREAERSGVYIVTIGVGTEDGGFVPSTNSYTGHLTDREGRPVISRMQSEVLRTLAESTKGRFAVAGSGVDISNLVKSLVEGMDAFEMEGRERTISIEFYQWLILPAILFLIASIVASTRWKSLQAAFLVSGMFIIHSPAEASEASIAKDLLQSERYAEAQKSYHNLAESTKRQGTQARYRLGEATAAYRAGQFREARTAFSGALLSRDPQVLGNAHLGMGNTLFQLGWKGLANDSYPTDPENVPDLDRFSTIVKEALAKLREADASDTGDSGGYLQIETLITNWTDAIRHYDSSAHFDSSNPAATRNSDLTLTFLKRLEELLEEEKNETQQALPQVGPGPPQEGEGEEEGEGDPKDGKGGKSPKPGGKGDPGEKRDPNQGPDGDEKGPNGTKKDQDESDNSKGENPNESSEERARRILKENADSEKGPLTPGRRDFGDAKKDW